MKPDMRETELGKISCRNCRWWWEGNRVEPNEGECRRNPPVPPAGWVGWAEFPRTHSNDFCGRHDQRLVIPAGEDP